MSATELAAAFPVSRQAVMKHLRILSRAGLVASSNHGREVRYSVEPRALRTVARQLEQVASNWDKRLTALKSMVETSPRRNPGS